MDRIVPADARVLQHKVVERQSGRYMVDSAAQKRKNISIILLAPKKLNRDLWDIFFPAKRVNLGVIR